MQEIKFQVWDKVRQKMFKPQAISFDIQTLSPFAVSVPGHSWEPVGKFDLLQWTGLSDAKGNNVYESDFINISSVIYRVIWNKSLAGFELAEAGSSQKRNISDVETGEVVGNGYSLGWVK